MFAGVILGALVCAGAAAALPDAVAAPAAAPPGSAPPRQPDPRDPLIPRQNGNGVIRRQQWMGQPYPEIRSDDPRWASSVLERVTVDAEVEALVARLDGATWAERQDATEALVALPVSSDQIWARLDRGGLSPEQHERLLEAACRRIVDRPRGALGIRMGMMAADRGGVLVDGLLPGLPARAVLKVGDRITEIDGRPIADSGDLIELVQGMAPGAVVHMVIFRPERDPGGRLQLGPNGQPAETRLQVEVPLGSSVELERVEREQEAGGMALRGRVTDRRDQEARALRERFGGYRGAVRVPGRASVPGENDSFEAALRGVEEQLRRGGGSPAGEAELRAMRGTLEELRLRAADPEVTSELRARLGSAMVLLTVRMREAIDAPQPAPVNEP